MSFEPSTAGPWPATRLTKLIEEKLQNNALGLEISVACIAAERGRFHSLRLNPPRWGVGASITCYHTGWDYLLGEYVRHTANCLNPNHLDLDVGYELRQRGARPLVARLLKRDP